MKNKIALLFLLLAASLSAQEKNKILVIGTFHFHLVQSQFGVEFNINDKEKQEELEQIANKIASFKPTKIFVEWDFQKQIELDEMYQMYLNDKTFQLIKNKYGKNENMYFESELQQLGFRLATKMNLKKLHAFDFSLPEDAEKVMEAIQKANQNDLMGNIQKEFGEYGQSIISQFQSKKSIADLLLFFNSQELENRLNQGYISLFNKAGSLDDFSGAHFVSERYRRNLYMYSQIQKQIENSGERILVIVGAQHSAGFNPFIALDSNFEKVELHKILNKN